MGVKVKQYLSTRVKKIAEKLKLPKITVERVIREYLLGLIDSALAGEPIVIDNIVYIHILRQEETGELFVRARISSSLRNKLKGVRLDVEDTFLDDSSAVDFIDEPVVETQEVI